MKESSYHRIRNPKHSERCFSLKNKTQIYNLLLLCLTICFLFPSYSLSQNRYLNNPSFEEPLRDPIAPPGGTDYLQFGDAFITPQANVPAWNTTHPITTDCVTPCIEIWDNEDNSLTLGAFEGSQWAELNADANSALYQEACLVNGETIDWNFRHRNRSIAAAWPPTEYDETARFEIANSAGVVQQTLISHTIPIGSVDQWYDVNGTSTITVPTGIYRLQFSTPDTHFTGRVGNWLDTVNIDQKPVVEFSGGTFSSIEYPLI